jgi:hypothetical protein
MSDAPITNDEVWDEAAAAMLPLVTEGDARRKDTIADFLAGKPTYGGDHHLPDPPPVIPATGATAGAPGAFTPSGAEVPANLAARTGITASPATAWTAGQHVVLGDASQAHWNGTAWAAGAAVAA